MTGLRRFVTTLVLGLLAAPASDATARARWEAGGDGPPDAPATADTAELFTIDDAIGLIGIDEPRLSPNGRRVVFTRSELDWADNERDRRLWVVGSDGEGPRPFTSEEGDVEPRWSPEGEWLAFVRSVDDEEDSRRQIFLLPTRGGEARQLTEHPTSVQDYRWGPGGERVFYVADDSLPDTEEERRENGYDAVFVNEGPNGQVRHGWSNLWAVGLPPDSGEARPVTEGERVIEEFAVGPEGRRVAFIFRREQHRNTPNEAEIAVAPSPLPPSASPPTGRR